MSGQTESDSRFHDLFGAFLGAMAAGILISTPWQVDTTGPDPFYKGPLIYPLLVLSLMILASMPSVWRLVRPPKRSSWLLDRAGFPAKTLIILVFLVAFLGGLIILGLKVSCLAFLAVSLYLLGHRHPAVLIFTPVSVTGLVVVVFDYFLDIYFPTPLLLEWLGG